MAIRLSDDAILLDEEMSRWIEDDIPACPALIAIFLGWDAEKFNKAFDELMSYYTED